MISLAIHVSSANSPSKIYLGLRFLIIADIKIILHILEKKQSPIGC